MASDTKTALELWERSVEQVKLATGALQSALKLMESATTTVVHDAWDTVCSARAALRSSVEEERTRFAVIEDQKRQTSLDLEGKEREQKAGAVAGDARVLPQEPLALPPHDAPATELEQAFEDPDAVVDEDEDEDAGEGEPDPNAGEEAPGTEEEGDEPGDREDEEA